MIKLRDIKNGKLVIFDLDDTIIRTDAKVKIIDRKTGEVIRELSPDEFNSFNTKPTHILDFNDFDCPEILRQGKFIFSIFNKLKEYYSNGIPVAILTARSSSDLVRKFFLENGIDIHPDLVIAVNDPLYDYKGSVAEMKKQAIKEFIDAGYTDLIFFDDNEDNLKLAKEAEGYKGSNIEIIKVT